LDEEKIRMGLGNGFGKARCMLEKIGIGCGVRDPYAPLTDMAFYLP